MIQPRPVRSFLRSTKQYILQFLLLAYNLPSCMLTCLTVPYINCYHFFLVLNVCDVRMYINEYVQRDVYKMLRGCSYLVSPKVLSADRSQRYSRRSVVYAIRFPSDFRLIRVLNSALVDCSRCALSFRFPEKYAHQNDPLNQGNLNELKLRLKIVRYPEIEVGRAQQTITQNMADQGRSDFYVVFTMSLCFL